MNHPIMFRAIDCKAAVDFAFVRRNGRYALAFVVGDDDAMEMELDMQLGLTHEQLVALAVEILIGHDLVAEVGEEHRESEIWSAIRRLLQEKIGDRDLQDPRLYLASVGQSVLAPQNDAWELRAGQFDEMGGGRWAVERQRLYALQNGSEPIQLGPTTLLRYTDGNGFEIAGDDLTADQLVLFALYVLTDAQTEVDFADHACPFLYPSLLAQLGIDNSDESLPSAVADAPSAPETESAPPPDTSAYGPVLKAVIAAGSQVTLDRTEQQRGIPAAREGLNLLLQTIQS